MNAIKVKELTRNYNGLCAVDGITFEVGQGEIFGYLGPNGAGKTTTIRMLTGQLRPTSGSARVMDCDIVDDRQQVALEKPGGAWRDPAFATDSPDKFYVEHRLFGRVLQ